MISIFFKHLKKQQLNKIEGLIEGSWINIENVSSKDLKFVEENTNLDKEDLIDCSDIFELPRIEKKRNTIIIFIRDILNDKKEELYTYPLTIIITDKYFFTISINKNDYFKKIIKNEDLDFSTIQKGKFLLNILLNVSKNYTKKIKMINQNVNLQKRRLKKIENLDLTKLIESEEVLNAYVSALVPMKNVFDLIASGEYLKLHEHDKDLIQDVIVSIRQSYSICSTNIRSIKNLRESYQIVFSNKLNRSIRILTSLTVILTVPTIIGSLYGMNVELPFSENPLAFLYIIILAILLSLLVLIIFYIKKWL